MSAYHPQIEECRGRSWWLTYSRGELRQMGDANEDAGTMPRWLRPGVALWNCVSGKQCPDADRVVRSVVTRGHHQLVA